MAKRLATLFAILGLAAGIVAPVRVERIFVANSGHGPGTAGLWMIVPIAAAVLAIAAIRTRSAGLVWATVGSVWGFVILAAWSLGTFFFWEALALLIAGILHLVAVKARWRALLAPLWLVAGATLLCPVLLTVDIVRDAASGGFMAVTHAPAVVYGSWLCAATIVVLGMIALTSKATRRTAQGGDPA